MKLYIFLIGLTLSVLFLNGVDHATGYTEAVQNLSSMMKFIHDWSFMGCGMGLAFLLKD